MRRIVTIYMYIYTYSWNDKKNSVGKKFVAMNGDSKCEKWRTLSHLQQFTIFFSDYRHRRSHVMAIKFSSPCLSYLDVYIKVEYEGKNG